MEIAIKDSKGGRIVEDIKKQQNERRCSDQYHCQCWEHNLTLTTRHFIRHVQTVCTSITPEGLGYALSGPKAHVLIGGAPRLKCQTPPEKPICEMAK